MGAVVVVVGAIVTVLWAMFANGLAWTLLFIPWGALMITAAFISLRNRRMVCNVPVLDEPSRPERVHTHVKEPELWLRVPITRKRAE